MADQEQSHIEPKKKRRKWPWITLAVLLVLLGSARWALQSDLLLDYVKNLAEEQTGQQLNAELSISSLRGDLLKEIQLTGISLRDSSDTLLTIDSIRVGYDIWSLFSSDFIIDEVYIGSAKVNARQLPDSSWNLLAILPESSDVEEAEKDTLDTDNPFPFKIKKLTLDNSSISVFSPYLLPDSTLSLDQIFISSNFALGKKDMEVGLDDLSLRLREGRLSEPFELQASALFKDDVVTLNDLVFSGGASLLRSAAFYDLNTDDFAGELELSPLGIADLSAYLEELPLRSDIQLSLGAKGNLKDFQLQLSLATDGLDKLDFSLQAGLDPDFVITGAELSLENLNPEILLDEPDLPTIANFEASINGYLPVEDHENADLEALVTISEIRYSPYLVNNLSVRSRMQNQNISGNLNLNSGNQNPQSDFSLNAIFSELPEWDVRFAANHINPGYWADDEDLNGTLTIRGNASGKGFEPGPYPVYYDIDITDIQILDQNIRSLALNGQVDEQDLSTSILLKVQESQLTADLGMKWALDIPEYTFDLTTKNFNLAEFKGLEDLPTDLAIHFYGEGQGFTPETITLSSYFRADSSVVNNEIINEFQSDISIQDTVITFSDAFLNSPIAEGSLDVRFHLLEMYDRENRVDFNLELKDLDVFAPLAGLEILRVPGNISGRVRPIDQSALQLTSTIDFNDVEVDTFSIARIHGDLDVILADRPDFTFDLEISEPGIPEFTARHLSLMMSGFYENEALQADYDFNFEVRDGSGISQDATIYAHPDSIHIQTDDFRIYDNVGFYQLVNPFEFQFVNNLVKVGRVDLESDNISTISLEFEQYGEKSFRGFFDGQDANLNLIQQIAMDEPMFDGFLSGRFKFDISETVFNTDAAFILHQFSYNGIEIDSISLDATTLDEWMELDFYIRDEQRDLLTANYLLPFDPTFTAELDSDFFQREVQGKLELFDIDLAYFKPFFEYMEMEEIEGRILAESNLSGTAGSPDMDGHFAFYDGKLSGVQIDSLDFSLDYSHQQDKLLISGLINSLEQRVLDLSGEIPLYIDFKTFDFSGPSETDSLMFEFVSTDFRLATLNQFIPSDLARNLRGILNTNVKVFGPKGDLDMEGFVRLTNGDIRIVENNIRFQNIRMNIELEPGEIYLRQFAAESSGSFNATGQISLSAFQPGDFDINFRARNFRVYDTRDIDLFISMNTNLSGSLEEPRLTGDLQIDRGTIFLDNFGERTVEEVQLDDPDEIQVEQFDFFTPLAMELKFTMERNFFLRNRRDPELNFDLRGVLDIIKAKGDEDVEVFGDLNIPSGYATTVFNKRFDMDSGSILFSGPATNPELNIRTLYRPRQAGEDIRIYYVITGTVEEPEFSYESEPEMEFQDIISYTIFGRPFASLAGWERTVSGRSETSMAADFALDILLDRVEQLAAERLGIDVVEIDNSQKSTGSGTTIKAGKYLTDKLFVAYLQELGGSNAGRQVVIEYLIRSNLDLIITASDDYRSGVDLLWRYDY